MASNPRDEEFLKKVSSLADNELMIYTLVDPDAHIQGLSQHPLQKVVRNHGEYAGKKFHTWKWLGKLYIVRLPVPDTEALMQNVPTGSPSGR